MAEITTFKGYPSDKPPTIPKPDHPVDPMIVTVQDGVPVIYPGCHGLGVRVVHPVNPNAPAKNMGLVMFYVPPHVVLKPGSHETEETYVILEGRGRMTFANFQRDVKAGDFVYLPPLVPARNREYRHRDPGRTDCHFPPKPLNESWR